MDTANRTRKFVCPSCEKPTAAFNGPRPFVRTQVITHLALCSPSDSDEEVDAIFAVADTITLQLVESA
jgi:hypothetical protein